jgi:hypothetical protein
MPGTGLWTLLRNSPTAFWLSLALIVVTVVELFITGKAWKEKWPKLLAAVISVASPA